ARLQVHRDLALDALERVVDRLRVAVELFCRRLVGVPVEVEREHAALQVREDARAPREAGDEAFRSITVKWLLCGALRRPRPSCWVKRVADSVGRSSNRTSTSGTSTPSPRTSTEKTQRSSPRANRSSSRERVCGSSSPLSATLSSPASVNLRAMKRA